MKQTTIVLTELVMGALILFFGIRVLLAPTGENEIWKRAAKVANQSATKEVESKNALLLEQVIQSQVPEIELASEVFETGENIPFFEVLRVKTERENKWKPFCDSLDTTLELLDISDKAGNHFGSEVFAENGEDSDEIVLPVSYERSSGKLCFYQSGSYVLKVKICDSMGRDIVRRITILVEAGKG